jgi:ribonucleoside-diphosphate reductase alpha chain
MDAYRSFIHLSRYSRFLDEKGRRESWEETVDRVINFWKDMQGHNLQDNEFEELRQAILNHEVMPSMRSMWSAGEALKKNHFRGYNCSFKSVDHPRVFDEILFILMAGTGVGFGCEAKDVNKLPIINDTFTKTERVITIEDSAEGWAKALRKLIADLYLGNEHEWDYSKVRPEGARLKTMGGRASGPKPLMDLFNFVTKTFKAAAGRKLRPIEVHDIVCKIAEIVVVGGVRRSALISISDLSDPEIRDCKSFLNIDTFLLLKEDNTHWKYSVTFNDGTYGKRSLIIDFHKEKDFYEKEMMENGQLGWWRAHPERALANNSASYEQKPSMAVFMDEWTALMKSGSGERGIVSRYGLQAMAPERRDADQIVGLNPCAEIALRDGQLCNLTEVVCRENDTKEDLLHKVRIATILGTLQASLTDFKYVRSVWKKNCEEEALLGVSLTGIQDCKLLRNPDPKLLEAMKAHAYEINKEYAARIGINPSAAITTVKPSGTVSQLVDSASGIHGRFAPYYIRRVRQANHDPLTQMLKDQGVPNEADVMNPLKTTVFGFPIKSPEGATLANEQTAIEQLENWLVFKKHWAEHSVSVTVYVKDHEWLDVGAWVYKHFDYVTGISFLPYSEHTYQQAPYEDITEEQYNKLVAAMPVVDFSKLSEYEQEDNTEGAQTLACAAGGCEI